MYDIYANTHKKTQTNSIFVFCINGVGDTYESYSVKHLITFTQIASSVTHLKYTAKQLTDTSNYKLMNCCVWLLSLSIKFLLCLLSFSMLIS